MTETRRAVRTTAEFFDDLDAQLRPERGPHGEPSVHDFQVFELLRVVEQFATGFDELPELIPGRPEYRVFITAGVMVPRLSVVMTRVLRSAATEVRYRAELDVDAARELYECGVSLARVGETFGVSASTVRNRFERASIATRAVGVNQWSEQRVAPDARKASQ